MTTINSQAFRGVLVPVVTPFTQKLAPDSERFVAICQWLLDQGADGLAVFGTTSEANSMSVQERLDLLDALVAAGVAPAKLMPGVGACALSDCAKMAAHAASKKCGGVLMLPPFYYKTVSDDGLFAFVSEVIQRVGSADLRLYLYHIPPMSQIPFSYDLIERLIRAYPQVVVGIKDSSGDWNNTKGLLDRFPGFGTFVGSEQYLLDTLSGGGAGCITATGNVNVAGIKELFLNWRRPDAEALQERVTQIRKTVESYPLIAAVKWIVADIFQDPAWRQLRPPLQLLNEQQGKALLAQLADIDFTMPEPRRQAV
jgi:4-hydroxy-tetrahydrodipicolinate synthase